MKGIAPEVGRLNGTSIMGLCAIISLSKMNEFGRSIADEGLTKSVKGYLEAVEPLVRAKADALKKTVFTEHDCAI